MQKRSIPLQGRVIVLLITVLSVLAACGPGPEAPAPSEPGPSDATPGARAVTLDFSPVPPSPLEEGGPPAGAVAVRSTDVAVSARTVTVWVYADPGNPLEEHTYLQDGDHWFDLGVTSYYGGTTTEVRDFTGDGTPELAVSGGLGATFTGLWVIGYDVERQAWVLWLRAGVPHLVLEEPDGRPVLIEDSLGALPPYVHIHRWNGTGFGSVDVATALGGDCASVDPATELIEVGTMDAGAAGCGASIRYRYRDGRLIPETERR